MSDRLLFPQLTEGPFVHQSPVVKLCKGLLAEALDRGFERLEILAPREGSPIAEIRAYRGESGSRYFEIPASMHQSVVRRFKAMAKMRRARPLDRSEEHTSELQSRPHLVCRLLLEKKKNTIRIP